MLEEKKDAFIKIMGLSTHKMNFQGIYHLAIVFLWIFRKKVLLFVPICTIWYQSDYPTHFQMEEGTRGQEMKRIEEALKQLCDNSNSHFEVIQ